MTDDRMMVNNIEAEQNRINELIRASFSFLKYMETIKDLAPLEYNMSEMKWKEAISRGLTFAFSKSTDHASVLTKCVSVSTQMHMEDFTAYTSQGPTTRTIWKFPWE